MTMPAGVYYAGDLCFVLHASWDEVCDLVIQDHKCLEGEFTLRDGRKFAIFNTTYGDGEYTDQIGRSYCVDSGSIGCIRLEDCDPDDQPLQYAKDGLASIETFQDDFRCMNADGIIMIGHIGIDTNGTHEEDYDEEDEGIW